MIRAIESRDLIMDEFSPDFFNPKSVKMTDLLREGAVYKPVQFPDRPSYNTPEYQRNEIIGQSRLEAALYEYLHKGRRSEEDKDKQTTAIIGDQSTIVKFWPFFVEKIEFYRAGPQMIAIIFMIETKYDCNVNIIVN